jgi:Flp pilus assembly protein TadD
MKSAQKIIFTVCGIILLLHVWGAINPTHDNWGVHFFGFYDVWISAVAFALVILCTIPKVQTSAIRYIDRFARSFRKLPFPIVFVLISSALIGLIYLFPAKLHLLGDGAILLRSVSLGITGDEITLSFRNQPLMFWIYRTAMALHPFETAPNPYTVYYAIDILAALGFLALVFWSLRYSQQPFVERVLLGCFLIFSAGTQFFFGYVENYVLQYVMTAAYAITGWLTLEKRVSIIIPILCFILLVMLHLGDLVYLPSLISLIVLKWKKNKLYAALFLFIVGIAGAVIMYFIGFNLIDMTRHLKTGSVDFLQPFTAIGGGFPYPMFSFVHLIDWFNDLMLAAPFGLFLVVLFVLILPTERRWKNPILLFLLVTTLSGFVFTWIINSGIGLARDWDLFAGFFMPLTILSFYLLNQPLEMPLRRNIIFLTVVILFVHTASWIGVNATPDKHLARMQTLNNPKYLSKGTQLAYNESLANFFFDNQRYNDARVYYERYMVIDSMNPRIIGNIADVFRKSGERDKYFYMLKRAVAANSPDPGVYSNLGVEYANRRDTALAIELNEKAIIINPAMQKAHANLGILYMSQKNYKLAELHFTTALNLGMREPVLFRYMGDLSLLFNDYKRAIQNYDLYLASKPSDERIRQIRAQVYQSLRVGQLKR